MFFRLPNFVLPGQDCSTIFRVYPTVAALLCPGRFSHGCGYPANSPASRSQPRPAPKQRRGVKSSIPSRLPVANTPTAEVALKQEERQPNFSITLLQIVASDSYPHTTRLASALFFKNFVKRNWTVSDRATLHEVADSRDAL